MTTNFWRRGWASVGMTLLLALQACGGGGGSSGGNAALTSSSVPATATVSWTPATINATSLVGTAGWATVSITINVTGRDVAWDTEEESHGVITQVKSYEEGNTTRYELQLSPDLPVGTYDTTIDVNVCDDEACTKPIPGGKASIPLHYEVKPIITASASTVALSRTGQEAAPSQLVHLNIPPEAGAVALNVETTRTDAFDVKLSGTELRVGTRQVRAGQYSASANIQSLSDSRYHWSLPVSYVVNAPATGEHDLIVSPFELNLDVIQGGITKQVVTVSRATWTSEFVLPVLVPQSNFFKLTDLGGDRYEVSADATTFVGAGTMPSFSSTLRFGATSSTTQQDVPILSYVTRNWGPSEQPTLGLQVNSDSTVAHTDWQRSIGLQSLLPSITTWRASSSTPWLKLVANSGRIGTDRLVVTIDPSGVPAPGSTVTGTVHVTADGAADALDLTIPLSNAVPQLGKLIGPGLVGSSGRIYMPSGLSGIDPQSPPAMLTVAGATLTGVHTVEEPVRLAGMPNLVLDLSNATPGTPVTVSWASAFSPSHVTVPVLVPSSLPTAAASQPLPYAQRRPPKPHPSDGGAYFADGDQVWRAAAVNGQWVWRHAMVAGLVDVAPSADGRKLFAATTSGAVIGLDADTLNELGRAMLPINGSPDRLPDAQAPAGQAALLLAADGRAFVSVVGQALGWTLTRGPDWVASQDLNGNMLDISLQPYFADPGMFLRGPFSDRGTSLVRSASGRTVMAVDPDGSMIRYTDLSRGWTSWYGGDAWGSIGAGMTLAAIADTGNRIVRSDGVLQVFQTPVAPSLATRLPDGFTAGGYALSADGLFAVVYGYRIDTTGSTPVAKDAQLWVLSLPATTVPDLHLATTVGTSIPLTALGCTGNLAAGETCTHSVAITLSAAGDMAYLSGPRGLAIVPMGKALQASRAPRPQASRASTAPSGWHTARPVKGMAKP